MPQLAQIGADTAAPARRSAINRSPIALTLGYIDDEDAPAWAGVVRRIVASGFIPTTSGQIWANDYDWNGLDDFSTYVRIGLGSPREALPINDPPSVPYTTLPRSSIVQVTKEDQYTDALLKFVPPSGYGVLFVTLHEHAPLRSQANARVEVRIDDECIGQFTPQMGTRFLPMIRHLEDRGLVTACWGDITGSAVAAEVRIDGVKANEANDDVLDGNPLTIPQLIPELADPMAYDLSAMAPILNPLPPVSPSIPAEPPDGSLVRFNKGHGRYNYVAVRRGSRWETTSTADRGTINEVMPWRELASRVRTFEIAQRWAPIDPRGDPRVRDHLAVVRFTIDGLYLAAINISNIANYEGDWYTTITDTAERRLPIGDRCLWSDISRAGKYIQVVTTWATLV